eukprot:364758-Chlamydomonas_euryale.AAC.7
MPCSSGGCCCCGHKHQLGPDDHTAPTRDATASRLRRCSRPCRARVDRELRTKRSQPERARPSCQSQSPGAACSTPTDSPRALPSWLLNRSTGRRTKSERGWQQQQQPTSLPDGRAHSRLIPRPPVAHPGRPSTAPQPCDPRTCPAGASGDQRPPCFWQQPPRSLLTGPCLGGRESRQPGSSGAFARRLRLMHTPVHAHMPASMCTNMCMHTRTRRICAHTHGNAPAAMLSVPPRLPTAAAAAGVAAPRRAFRAAGRSKLSLAASEPKAASTTTSEHSQQQRQQQQLLMDTQDGANFASRRSALLAAGAMGLCMGAPAAMPTPAAAAATAAAVTAAAQAVPKVAIADDLSITRVRFLPG